MIRILIVEDDQALGNGIFLALRQADYDIVVVTSIAQADAQLSKGSFDLILLDINLPDGSGIDLLKRIKSTNDTPIIMITANDLESDIVTGLELGADDYITKPFSLMVLRARINTQLRRDNRRSNNYVDQLYHFDFDHLKFTVVGHAIELSKSEIKLLHKLVMNSEQIITREQLMDCLWQQDGQFVDENALSVTINRLRKKLSHAHEYESPIATIYGLGYKWKANHEER